MVYVPVADSLEVRTWNVTPTPFVCCTLPVRPRWPLIVVCPYAGSRLVVVCWGGVAHSMVDAARIAADKFFHTPRIVVPSSMLAQRRVRFVRSLLVGGVFYLHPGIDVREGPEGHAVEGHRAQQRHRGKPHPQGGDPRAPRRHRRGRQGTVSRRYHYSSSSSSSVDHKTRWL